MLSLILGGSGSGKSEYAENYLISHGKGPLIYAATMRYNPEDAECVKRIERHRNMRGHKGFSTVECPLYLERIEVGPQSRILLECMSNLTANEMFLDGNLRPPKETAAKIIKGIDRLCAICSHVCVVSNDIFGDGCQYDEGTMAYIEALGLVNQYLALRADQVWEVIYGIPVPIKEKNGWPRLGKEQKEDERT